MKNLLPLVALILSGIALLSTFWWNWLTYKFSKKHAINSVKPLLSVKCGTINNQFKITATNVGIGPCLVNKIHYQHKEVPYPRISDLLMEVTKDSEIIAQGHFVYTGEGDALAPNETLLLYESIEDGPPGVHYWTLFKDASVIIEYSDIYNTPFNCNRRLIAEDIADLLPDPLNQIP